MKKFHLIMTSIYMVALAFAVGGCQGCGCDMQKKDMHKDMGPCEHLSRTEKTFAMKLSQVHRMAFCERMDMIQRREAMDMAERGTSPDMAVEEVLQKHQQSKTCPNTQ